VISGWRLVKKVHEATAFSGEGARRFGGRWNHRGIAVVYLSDSLALAALELFVHLGPSHSDLEFASFEVQIPDSVSSAVLEKKDLPKDWRTEPAPVSCKDLGSDWVRSKETGILIVPSVIVPVQSNYILNINHEDFRDLKIDQNDNFSFDPRMWK